MKKAKFFVLSFFSVFVAVFAPICPLSCRMTETGVAIFSRNVTAPELLDFRVISNTELQFNFSAPVKLENLKITGKNEIFPTCTSDDERKNFSIIIEEKTKVGEKYEISGIVTDDFGSSLTFGVEFIGYNSNPAQIVFSEIRSESSKSTSKNTSKGIYNEEFIEFFCIKSGNLAGFEIVSGNYGEANKYVFPPIEVEKGEYIVVHYRNRDDVDGSKGLCVNEMERKDIALSNQRDSCATAWDLWFNNQNKLVTSNDVILLRNCFRENVIDCVCYCENPDGNWKNALQGQFAIKAINEGKWNGDGTKKTSAQSSGVTATRTLSRQNLEALLGSGYVAGSKDDWIVTATASPGKPNSTKLYVPK